MKKILFFIVVICFGCNNRIVSHPYNQTKIGDFTLQNGKIYYVKTINFFNPETYKKQILKNDTPNNAIKVNMVTADGIKGTFVNFPLDWASLHLSDKKLDPFLKLPFNATFEIIKDGQEYRLRVTNIWFNKSSAKSNLTLEDIVCDKRGLDFLRDRKHVRALNILNMNMDDIFMPKSNF